MKQDVIPGPRLRRHERAGDGRGSTREHYRPRRNGERQRHRGGKSDWHQWSLEAIMQRFADCCRQIHDQLASCTVRGITVTTFGVDGALVDEQGALLYPIISWKCPRTAAVMEKISQYMPARQLQRIAGVGAFAFNTLYKLVWLKENHPQLLAQAHAWLFISSLINHRLTGEFTTDLTMAGTSQMLDLRQRDFSAPILQATGLPRRLFPRLVEAGQPIGALLPEAAALLGLPVGIPVISAGHDTQFALFGAGAGQDEPVLSSGTSGDPDGAQRAGRHLAAL